MPEHLIRLRGGWLCIEHGGLLDLDVPASASGPRITLPILWGEQAGPQAAVRILRSFTVPSLNPSRERLSLRMSGVRGLVSVQLNGRELARPAPGTTALEIPLRGPLPRRNRLVLDIGPEAAVASREFPEQAWGSVALVISVQGPPEDVGAGCGDESLGGDDLPA